ncbi:hypothetical protein [Bacillus subtilis]|uniref:hypothetical protein n=1 Tax=Bacillus subtilis TaxID=1423 RepID=UPI0002C4E663|nr:hypothetical protein [Bacillus subtilis]AGI30599.1 hypothetical protein I653_16805 [Bacillus subtilis subsp. subtilis str. BAB-1]AKD36661.1 hypothetical protein AW03_032900 [Bacillus subtilis HJ5]ALS80626.1 hypothetical protein AT706_01365 [Bacillus subtilis subsp. subtilis]MBR0022578.1 hypothetical protein [Bacillus subtilis]MCL9626634.1 hypothetical protein [Bacillus subtilis]
MRKSSNIWAVAVIIGTIITLFSFVFLRDTDFYAVRWVGVVIMVVGFVCGPTYIAPKNKNNRKKDTR